jgi:undecaprenyl pyrophosphate phosphatase UppP
VFELLHKESDNAVAEVTAIPYSKALLIGLFQSLSIVPGVSRAGATIVGGLILGLSRSTIVEFSFLLAVPTMLAATGYDLLKNASSFEPQQFGVLAAGFISFFCGLAQHQVLAGFCADPNLYPVRHLSHRRRAGLRVPLTRHVLTRALPPCDRSA